VVQSTAAGTALLSKLTSTLRTYFGADLLYPNNLALYSAKLMSVN